MSKRPCHRLVSSTVSILTAANTSPKRKRGNGLRGIHSLAIRACVRGGIPSLALRACILRGLRQRSAVPLGLVLLCAAVVAAATHDALDPLATAKSAMRAGQFDVAVQTIDRLQQNDLPHPDEAIYLKALAEHYLKQFEASLVTAEIVISQHPDSPWLRKARFLKARSLVSLRRFQEAEAIYQQETQRLLSKKRKHQIADVIINFADALAKKPDPQDVGAPPPDYGKAYKLYGKVLEMEIARELRDTVMYRRARTTLLSQNHDQAINEFRAYLAEYDPDWTGNVGSVTRMSDRKRE